MFFSPLCFLAFASIRPTSPLSWANPSDGFKRQSSRWVDCISCCQCGSAPTCSFVDFNKHTSLGRHEQTALGSNTRGSSSLLKSLQSFVDLFCKIVPAHKLWGRRGQWSNNVCLTPPRCPLPSAGSGKVAVNYSDQNLHHHFQRLQDGSEGRLEIKEQRRGTKRTREEITPIHSALLLR